MGLLDGRIAIVSGAAQGIGLAIADIFVDQGGRVVIGDLDADANSRAVAELGGADVARGVVCDVTDASQVEALVRASFDAFGSMDVSVNNAGITRDAAMRKMTEDQFGQVISVHLKGCWKGTRAGGGVAARSRAARS